MKIELDRKQMDEISIKTIISLEKQVASLSGKLSRKESEISRLKGKIVPGKKIDEIISLTRELADKLKSAGFLEIEPF